MNGVLARSSVNAVATRLQGRQPSRQSAILLSAAVGVGAAVGVYKLLRSGQPDEDDQQAQQGDQEAQEG